MKTKKIPTQWVSLAVMLFLIAILCIAAKSNAGAILFSILGGLVLYCKRGAEETAGAVFQSNQYKDSNIVEMA